MKKTYPAILAVAMILAACAPARTTLQDPQSGRVVICDAEGEEAEGMVGYNTSKTQSRECIEGYMRQGYNIIDTDR